MVLVLSEKSGFCIYTKTTWSPNKLRAQRCLSLLPIARGHLNHQTNMVKQTNKQTNINITTFQQNQPVFLFLRFEKPPNKPNRASIATMKQT